MYATSQQACHSISYFVSIPFANAETIIAEITKNLELKNWTNKIVGSCFDGEKCGVSTRSCNKANQIVSMHCCAHTLF